MNILDDLTSDQRANISSLPYRVGLWIALSDRTGGRESDEKELVALANIIEGFSTQVFGSELVQYIMAETVSRKYEWGSWGGQLEKVPEECAQALSILREHVDEKDVNAYVTRLMEIAEAVALAFREHEHLSPVNRFCVYITFIVKKMTFGSRETAPKTLEQFLNISPVERKALVSLAKSLGTTYSL